MNDFRPLTNRRKLLLAFGHATAALVSIGLVRPALARPPATSDTTHVGKSTGALKELSDRLLAAPRRRDFKSVPLVVTDPGDWDRDAAAQLLSYKYGPFRSGRMQICPAPGWD